MIQFNICMSAVTQPPPHRPRRGPQPARLVMPAILLLAFALRACGLDAQSLWSDEGISLQRASQSLPDLLANMPVEHTPGYFVLLHGWLSISGASDFALRYLSLLPSVLAVALIFALARALHRGHGGRGFWGRGFWVGVIAALLAATSGFQVWYAQEARMYAWLQALALLAIWAQWQLLEGADADTQGQETGPAPRRTVTSDTVGWAATYALATAGVIYLHLYGALLPLAQALFALGWLAVRRTPRPFVHWLSAAALALLLFAPWLPHALGILGFDGWREGGSAADLPWRFWAAYTVSDGLAEPWSAWLPWLYALLLLAGVIYWARERAAAALYLLLLLLGPSAAVLLLAIRNPDYHERYTIFLSAPILLLVAGGIGAQIAPPADHARMGRPALRRAGALLLLLLLLIGNGLALYRLRTDATLHKPDYRSAAAHIAANLQPGDVVLVDGPDPAKVFLHYFDADSAPVYAVGDLQEADYAASGAALAPLLDGAGRVWELLYFHPPAAVQVWLATQAWASEATEYNGIRVTLYGLSTDKDADAGENTAEPSGVQTRVPPQVTFGPTLTLQSVEVNPPAPQGGDLLRVSTHWFVNEAAPEYKFSLRLTDAAGLTIYTADYTPQNWFAPTNVWVVGQPATDQRGILLPPDLPGGVYRLALRLYDPATGVAVESSAGQDVVLADLSIGMKQP